MLRLASLACLLAASWTSSAADLPLYGVDIPPGSTRAVSWTAQGYGRSARVHVPTGYTGSTGIPLVVVLHGGGGTAASIEASSGWSTAADAAGWLAVYPQGLSLDSSGVDDPTNELAYWANDRGTRPDLFGVDDVGVITGLIDAIAAATPVDRDRVYAMGMSNGAMMVHRLGRDSAGTWAALCAVSGSYTAEPTVTPFAPAFPVSMLIIHGTSDTIVPYAGGTVSGQGGPVIGVEATRDLWLQADGISSAASESDLPDTVADGCTSRLFAYAGGQAGTRVSFIRVTGGNHSWPGGSGSAGAGAGSKTDDFSATDTAQAFFSGSHREPEIAISDGALAIGSGGTDLITGTVIGTARDIAYTVANHGSGQLTCSGFTISTHTGCDAIVLDAPGAVATGSTHVATLRVTPTAATWGVEVSVANDDADEAAYAWTVSGTANPAGSGSDDPASGGDSGGGCGLGAVGLLLGSLVLAGFRRSADGQS